MVRVRVRVSCVPQTPTTVAAHLVRGWCRVRVRVMARVRARVRVRVRVWARVRVRVRVRVSSPSMDDRRSRIAFGRRVVRRTPLSISAHLVLPRRADPAPWEGPAP